MEILPAAEASNRPATATWRTISLGCADPSTPVFSLSRLWRDLPERELCRGDLGAVVEIYEPDGLEVEFVTASGKTEALVTLRVSDVRAVEDHDLITVRSFGRSA